MNAEAREDARIRDHQYRSTQSGAVAHGHGGSFGAPRWIGWREKQPVRNPVTIRFVDPESLR